jgi:TonB family protein
MPPIAKENEIATGKPESTLRSASTAAPGGDAAIKQQPVALEVSVTVNGARAVDGSDKREPFSETTKTVLIFGNGAVIRLSSSVGPGQLLFLTNEKTKKEVVCQVVKSKNYRNVSGYVELEFTEPVVGFWGMRFPGDRIGSAPQPVPSAPVAVGSSSAGVIATKPAPPVSVARDAESKLTKSKIAIPTVPVSPVPAPPKLEDLLPQKPVAPVAPLSSALSTSFDPEAPLSLRTPPPAPSVPVVPATPVSAASELPVNFPPAKPAAPASVLFDSPRATDSPASFLDPAKPPAAGATSVPNLLSLFEAKQATPAVDAPSLVQVSADPETETLKQHTARLQEQLSNMQFSGEPAEPATVSVQIPHAAPITIKKELAESAAKALEMSRVKAPDPAAVEPSKIEPAKLEPAKVAALPVKSSLENEEMKIPAWLEPLARNAAAPTSTQELIEREKTKRLAELPKLEESAVQSFAAVGEQAIAELPIPAFGNALPLLDDQKRPRNRSGSSSKGMLIAALAAGVLLLAGGGWWYVQQQSGGVHAGIAPASNVQASVASLPAVSAPSQTQGNAVAPANLPPQTTPASLTNASAKSNAATNGSSVVPAVASTAKSRDAQPAPKTAKDGAGAMTSAEAPAAVAEQPKKPILGAVHLATPKVTHSGHAQDAAEPDASVVLSNEVQAESGVDPLNSGLGGGNKQPSAPAEPLPVGGDVQQAKLISSVAPVYPALAKNQHVSGNVLVDALIDATGRVTTMKIVSGPTLLHQAAMDALKQWKYRPALLDGKPVPMHLTVTIQFRLQ